MPICSHISLLAILRSSFNDWLNGERDDRRNRNRKLVDSLRNRGVDITLQEVEARGKSLAGRPHFARILVEKGYARDSDDAFRRYLGENAPSYVQRESQTTEEAIRIVRAGGGIPVIAHPVRLSLPRDLERGVLLQLKGAGLLGLEVYHSEHPPRTASSLSAACGRTRSAADRGLRFSWRSKTRRALGDRIGTTIFACRSSSCTACAQFTS